MLATFLASTPLLDQSWKLCSHANTAAPQNYVVNQIENVTYLAFSGVQTIAGLDPSCRNLVPLEIAGNGLFSALHRHVEGEKPVMVHSGLLSLFLSFHATQNFQNQVSPCQGSWLICYIFANSPLFFILLRNQQSFVIFF